MFFFLNQSINISCLLLKINNNYDFNKSVIDFILNLELKTRILILLGSLSLVFFYYFFLFFLTRKLQVIILQNIPLISKVLSFYRKIILITYYEEESN